MAAILNVLAVLLSQAQAGMLMQEEHVLPLMQSFTLTGVLATQGVWQPLIRREERMRRSPSTTPTQKVC